ncbi:MAG TPA: hypothetical protein VNG13_00970 [Mycobacteriales bacterium]|nr:hypothetical protein [Mycobacteriales bacterium]
MSEDWVRNHMAAGAVGLLAACSVAGLTLTFAGGGARSTLRTAAPPATQTAGPSPSTAAPAPSATHAPQTFPGAGTPTPPGAATGQTTAAPPIVTGSSTAPPDTSPVVITVLVGVSPSHPVAGQTVTITARGYDRDGGIPFISYVNFGDGQTQHFQVHVACPAFPESGPNSNSQSVAHTYANAGTYQITVGEIGSCGIRPGRGTGSATARVAPKPGGTPTASGSPTPSPSISNP